MNGSQKEVIIVTGSSGLIGTRIIKRLAGNFRIVGFDQMGNPFPPEEPECVCIDIKSEESNDQVDDLNLPGSQIIFFAIRLEHFQPGL
jgi:nucleoside-diphosphate-sugar epimerase